MAFERGQDFKYIGAAMKSRFTLEYWRDGSFYVGRVLEVPGVFSQGETMDELQENIQDAYDLMVTKERPL
jgi:predicted RNase H-like HicB family nuclease